MIVRTFADAMPNFLQRDRRRIDRLLTERRANANTDESDRHDDRSTNVLMHVHYFNTLSVPTRSSCPCAASLPS